MNQNKSEIINYIKFYKNILPFYMDELKIKDKIFCIFKIKLIKYIEYNAINKPN